MEEEKAWKSKRGKKSEWKMRKGAAKVPCFAGHVSGFRNRFVFLKERPYGASRPKPTKQGLSQSNHVSSAENVNQCETLEIHDVKSFHPNGRNPKPPSGKKT